MSSFLQTGLQVGLVLKYNLPRVHWRELPEKEREIYYKAAEACATTPEQNLELVRHAIIEKKWFCLNNSEVVKEGDAVTQTEYHAAWNDWINQQIEDRQLARE